MALFECAECLKYISDKASSCPHCGCPIAATSGVATQYSPNSNVSDSSSNSGCGGVVAGIGMLCVGGLICLVAIKVFNFIVGLVGGVMALIGLGLMGLVS
jgi:hypothetical protein